MADEYHQSNIDVTFCTIFQEDFFFHTNTGIRFMHKSTNDEKISENICEINSCV